MWSVIRAPVCRVSPSIHEGHVLPRSERKKCQTVSGWKRAWLSWMPPTEGFIVLPKMTSCLLISLLGRIASTHCIHAPIATDVTRSVVCMSVCLYVGHTGELRIITWTDQDAVYVGADSYGSNKLCIRGGPDPHEKGHFWGGGACAGPFVRTYAWVHCSPAAVRGGRMHAQLRGMTRQDSDAASCY